MIEYSKTYRDRIRRKGPLVKASIGHMFEATGKTKTEARTALETDVEWYLNQNATPEVRIDPDGATWVLYLDSHGYSYGIHRVGRGYPSSSLMNCRDKTEALILMLTHMCDCHPEETWDSFLWGLTELAKEKIRTEIRERGKLRAESA